MWIRRQPGRRAVGKIQHIKPDKLSSYIYYHYQYQEERPGECDMFGQISLYQNLLFFYLEEPELIMPPGAPGKLHTHHTPENWAETMDPHFEKWADQATPYIWKPVQCLYQYFYVES